jgi:hypothetical protein
MAHRTGGANGLGSALHAAMPLDTAYVQYGTGSLLPDTILLLVITCCAVHMAPCANALVVVLIAAHPM